MGIADINGPSVTAITTSKGMGDVVSHQTSAMFMAHFYP
jgi:hypothetical protein